MKKLVFAGLLGAAALFSTGCANACERAASRIEDRLEACGLNVPDEEGEEMECTDSEAATQERFADCVEKADCDTVRTGAWITNCPP